MDGVVGEVNSRPLLRIPIEAHEEVCTKSNEAAPTAPSLCAQHRLRRTRTQNRSIFAFLPCFVYVMLLS